MTGIRKRFYWSGEVLLKQMQELCTKLSGRQAGVATVAILMIVFSSVYLADSVQRGDFFQTASVIDSQVNKSSESALSAVRTYNIVRYFNTEIEKLVEVDTNTKKTSLSASVLLADIGTGPSAPPPEILESGDLDETGEPEEEPSFWEQMQNSIRNVTGGGGEKKSVVPDGGTGGFEEVDAAPFSIVDSATKEEKLARLVSERRDLMESLAVLSPTLFGVASLSEEIRAQLPSVIQVDIEKSVSLTGKIEVSYFDNFERPEESLPEYYLMVNDERLSLQTTRDLNLISGAILTVDGFMLGNTVVAFDEDITIVSSVTTPTTSFSSRNPPPSPGIGEKRVLVLLVNFQDSGVPSVTPAEMHDRIFDGPFQDFYSEQSYRKISFVGDVLGWYTLPRNTNSNPNPNSNLPAHPYGANELATLVANNNIDFSNYDHVVFAFDGISVNTSRGTIGRIDSQGLQYPVTFIEIGLLGASLGTMPPANFLAPFDKVLSHEMGHNLGLQHARGLDCGNVSLRPSGCADADSGYGNHFDTMADGGYGLHFNAFYKELLGWIPSQETILITQNGRYTISPLEDLSTTIPIFTSPKRLAKIQMANSSYRPFYLEYRQGIGFDRQISDSTYLSDNQDGLMINYIHLPYAGQTSVSTFLLDMRATSQAWADDIQGATLNGSSVFSDPATGITIGPIVSYDDSAITFDVNTGIAPCVQGNPLMSQIYLPSVTPGQVTAMHVSFGNGDSVSCGSSRFNLLTNMPTSWSPAVVPHKDVLASPNVSTAIDQFKTIKFTVPAGTTAGTYPTTVTVFNRTTGSQTNQTVNIQVINPPVIRTIAPNFGGTGTSITLTGTNFGSSPSVHFNGPAGYADYNLTSHGNTVSFVIPEFLSGYNCNPGPCSVPTPPGVYQISLFNDSLSSSPVNFQVIP